MLRYTQALTLLLVLAFGGYRAWSWPRRVDSASSERYDQTLRSMLALQIELTAELMKTRSGLVSNYDGLVRIEAGLHDHAQRAQQAPRFLPTAAREQLRRTVDSLERARRATEELIETFKTNNAVLRNSIRFLPVAAAEIDALSDANPETRAYKQRAAALVRDVLLLHDWNDQAILARVSESLRALTAPGATDRLPAKQELSLVLLHAGIVRERAPVVDELVRRILSEPTPARTEALLSRYTVLQRAAVLRAERDAQLLFGLALCSVLSGSAWIMLRMRRTAQQLRVASDQLSQAVASLRVEQEKQRELAELKSRFVSMTSHEFRTPLSTIMSSSEMLAAYSDKWSVEKKEQHFQRIRSSVQGMTRMLDGILLIGRSDAGMLSFNPARLDLGKFCADAVESAVLACRADHEIVLEGPEPEPAVIADEALLRHMVDNLLSNAVKYSPRGSKVLMKVSREGQDVVLDVRDQGIGIPDADQKRLFETFHRGGNVGTTSGSGLGLSIVKRAVDLHGGSLALESAVGVGTRFTIRLPCPRSEA